MGAPDSHQAPRFPSGTQELSQSLLPFAYGTFTLCGRSFQSVRLGIGFVTLLQAWDLRAGLTTPERHRTQSTESFGFRLLPVRSPLLGEYFSVPRGTKMFQFPRLPLSCLCIQHGVADFQSAGLPHSETPGLAC